MDVRLVNSVLTSNDGVRVRGPRCHEAGAAKLARIGSWTGAGTAILEGPLAVLVDWRTYQSTFFNDLRHRKSLILKGEMAEWSNGARLDSDSGEPLRATPEYFFAQSIQRLTSNRCCLM
jgi:hypothetical protein